MAEQTSVNAGRRRRVRAASPPRHPCALSMQDTHGCSPTTAVGNSGSRRYSCAMTTHTPPKHSHHPVVAPPPRPYARYPSSYEDFEPYFSTRWRVHFVRTFALLTIIAIVAAL